MARKRTYYQLLHVQPDAPEAVIKASYRAIMQKLRMHPDLGGDVDHAGLLNQAFATLIHPDKRRSYDKKLSDIQVNGKQDPAGRRCRTADKDGGDPGVCHPEPQSDGRAFCNFCKTQNLLERKSDPDWKSIDRCRTCHAPLKKLRRPDYSTKTDLRELQRISLDTSVRLTPDFVDNTVLSAKVLDFSIGGLGVEVSESIDTGKFVLIQSRYFEAVAKVTQAQSIESRLYRIGLEFHTLELAFRPGELLSVSC